MGCATGIVKYLVFIANLVFALAGLALITLGCVFQFNFASKISSDELLDNYSSAPILTIVVGVIVFVTAFFGCCGAVRESTCMLTTYSIILLSIFIIQIALGVYAFLSIRDESDFRTQLQSKMKTQFDSYSSKPTSQEVVDSLQKFLECCGMDGPSYWSTSTVPASCCENQKTCSSSSSDLYDRGCFEEMYEFVKDASKIIGYVVIGIAVVEIIGALFGLCLASSIRNHYRRNIYA